MLQRRDAQPRRRRVVAPDPQRREDLVGPAGAFRAAQLPRVRHDEGPAARAPPYFDDERRVVGAAGPVLAEEPLHLIVVGLELGWWRRGAVESSAARAAGGGASGGGGGAGGAPGGGGGAAGGASGRGDRPRIELAHHAVELGREARGAVL